MVSTKGPRGETIGDTASGGVHGSLERSLAALEVQVVAPGESDLSSLSSRLPMEKRAGRRPRAAEK